MSAIVGSEIVPRFSTTAGAAGDANANTTVGTFLGKYASTSAFAGSANDLFADITGAQNAASQVDYAGLALLNNNGANTLQNAVVYLSAETAGGASIAVAADSTAITAKASATPSMLTIANNTTAPAGPLTFSSPTTLGGGVALGNIPIAQVKGVWVRRTAANTAALSSDGVTLAFAGDTGSL